VKPSNAVPEPLPSRLVRQLKLASTLDRISGSFSKFQAIQYRI
jgi:hypothetical protein